MLLTLSTARTCKQCHTMLPTAQGSVARPPENASSVSAPHLVTQVLQYCCQQSHQRLRCHQLGHHIAGSGASVSIPWLHCPTQSSLSPRSDHALACHEYWSTCAGLKRQPCSPVPCQSLRHGAMWLACLTSRGADQCSGALKSRTLCAVCGSQWPITLQFLNVRLLSRARQYWRPACPVELSMPARWQEHKLQAAPWPKVRSCRRRPPKLGTGAECTLAVCQNSFHCWCFWLYSTCWVASSGLAAPRLAARSAHSMTASMLNKA